MNLDELIQRELEHANAAADAKERALFEHGYGAARPAGEITGLGVFAIEPGPARMVERYLRVSIEVPGGSIEAGLQRAAGEPLALLRAELHRLLESEALVLNGDDITDDNAAPLIDAIDQRIAATWPARAWFVEIWQADECLSQVYAPYGMPRHR